MLSSVRSEGSRAEYLYLLFDDEDHIPLDTHVFNTEVSRNLSSAGEPDPRRPVGGVRVRWATLAQWDDSWWSSADAALAPVPIDLLLGRTPRLGSVLGERSGLVMASTSEIEPCGETGLG